MSSWATPVESWWLISLRPSMGENMLSAKARHWCLPWTNHKSSWTDTFYIFHYSVFIFICIKKNSHLSLSHRIAFPALAQWQWRPHSLCFSAVLPSTRWRFAGCLEQEIWSGPQAPQRTPQRTMLPAGPAMWAGWWRRAGGFVEKRGRDTGEAQADPVESEDTGERTFL